MTVDNNTSINTLNEKYKFSVALKTLPTEGNLVYEYNPFYNYRLDLTMIYYKDKLWSIEEFTKEFNINYDAEENVFWKERYEPGEGETEGKIKPLESWEGIIPSTETLPVVYQKGLLTNFETDELDFSLKHPVNILPQYSYDNSVNLIINDGENPPRLINSRFSATEKNKYLVCNRNGNNDSNIYDKGEQFDVDTSLYKKMITIPKLKFLGVSYGGNLSIGNYHFYFRYVDDDGNETDYFAESGLVSIFIGNSANSIHTGFANQNARKLVKFLLSNTEPSYNKVAIYYTKSTSEVLMSSITQSKRITLNYKLNDNGTTIIVISGFEETYDVTLEDINPRYLLYGSAETQETALNILFLGNLSRPKIPYEDLADCALRFVPILNRDETYNINLIGIKYTGPNLYISSSQ